MPINIPIYINDRFITNYRIGRLGGDTDPDSVNQYLIIEGDGIWGAQPQTWFHHRYGDGLEVCVIKGLQAMKTMDRIKHNVGLLLDEKHMISWFNTKNIYLEEKTPQDAIMDGDIEQVEKITKIYNEYINQ